MEHTGGSSAWAICLTTLLVHEQWFYSIYKSMRVMCRQIGGIIATGVALHFWFTMRIKILQTRRSNGKAQQNRNTINKTWNQILVNHNEKDLFRF
jgi:hypothetical protein